MRAVAVDGKSLRGSKNREGQRVHLLSVVDHAAAVCLAQRNVGSKTNETGEFVPLLAWMDLAGAVVTFDALHTVKAQVTWLIEAKGADYLAIAKANQEHLYWQLRSLPWGEVGRGAFSAGTGHGRIESRSIKACGIEGAAGGLPFPVRSPRSSCIAAARSKEGSSPRRSTFMDGAPSKAVITVLTIFDLVV